ncbi:MAG: asparaginase domain-containing protein [Phycisphaerales bacterium]
MFAVTAKSDICARKTILVVNCGGTFSSDTRHHDQGVDINLPDHDTVMSDIITSNVFRHLAEYHGNNIADLSSDGVNFIHVTVPAELYILSENATLSFWHNILSLVADATYTSDDRIVGAIIIHGTDTLAYAAPATQLFINKQSFPIVFVAANTPLRVDPQDERLSYFSSDAWYNFIHAAYFILVAGTKYPHTYACFGGHIFHPFNLRKSPIETSRLLGGTGYHRKLAASGVPLSPESFRFTNSVFRQPCLATELAGHWIIPADSLKLEATCDPADTNILELLHPETEYDIKLVDSVLGYRRCTPTSGGIESASDDKARLLLVETYASGTIPTDTNHPLAKYLKAVIDSEKIDGVALVGPDGLSLNTTYSNLKTHEILGTHARCGSLICETAVPLLSIAAFETASRYPNLVGAEYLVETVYAANSRLSGLISGDTHHEYRIATS